MPLVTRTSNQGNFFREDEEPPNWQNADLWADTNLSPRGLFINNDGTALQLGSASLAQTVEAAIGLGGVPVTLLTVASFFSSSTYTDLQSVTFTPSTAINVILVVGWCNFNRKGGGDSTGFLKITEGVGDIIAEETVTMPAGDIEGIMLMGSQTNVSAVSHTYDLEGHTSVAAGVDFMGSAGIGIFEVS